MAVDAETIRTVVVEVKNVSDENNKHLYPLLGKTISKKSDGTQNCVLKLDVTMENLSALAGMSF